ncbi:MAG: DUF424 family protein [Candidatus Micrarchaeaceae archaeon]
MKNFVYVKVHHIEGSVILAMCDQDIIEAILEDGKLYIDIKNYSDFYKGDLIDSRKPNITINKDMITSSNIVGNASIELAISWGIINSENVMSIKGVKYAQSYKVEKKL